VLASRWHGSERRLMQAPKLESCSEHCTESLNGGTLPSLRPLHHYPVSRRSCIYGVCSLLYSAYVDWWSTASVLVPIDRNGAAGDHQATCISTCSPV
jgi:hypothetical protein